MTQFTAAEVRELVAELPVLKIGAGAEDSEVEALGDAPCGSCDVCDPRPGLGARPSQGRRALAALAAVLGTTRS